MCSVMPPLLLEQPRHDGLLHVPTVLGLVPDDAVRPVDHLGGDLLAAVGGQAVQHDRVVGRRGQQRVVELPRPEDVGRACVRLGLPAHRDPRVGGEYAGSGGCLDRVGTYCADPPVLSAISRARARTAWSGS